MAQLRLPHPYDPRFALPGNVLAEPPGRGTLTTVQMPRKTFSSPPSGWTGGFHLPEYIASEPTGRGAVHSHWARRRTIPMKISSPLGDVAMSADPIALYGHRAAEYLLGTIHDVPPEFRLIALEALLNELDPGLYERVTKRANAYKRRSTSDKEAVRDALASSMSEGMAREMIALGTKGRPSMPSLLGLGFYGPIAYRTALHGLFGSIKKGIGKVGSAIKGGAKTVGRGVAYPFKQAGRGIKKGASYVKKGAIKAWEWGKAAVSKLGSLACGVLQSPATATAAGAAAMAYGAPPQAGQAGAAAGARLCTKSETPAVPQAALMTPGGISPTPRWVLPAAAAGGALVLLLALRRS